MKKFYFLLIGILIVIVAGISFVVQKSADEGDEEVKIKLYSDPFPMVVGQMNLMISITDENGQPIEGVDVHVTTQHSQFGSPAISDTSRRYEDGYYYMPVFWEMMGKASVIINAEFPNGETQDEEFEVFIYGIPPMNVENQPYRSQSEIAEELANIPDNEYWIVMPQGAQEITGIYSVDIVPPLIPLSVSGINTLVIRNDDLVPNTVGPFYVGAGETLRQRFTEPIVLIGECTVAQGLVRIEVTE